MALEAGRRRRRKKERRWEAAAMEVDPNCEGCAPRRLTWKSKAAPAGWPGLPAPRDGKQSR